MTDVISGPDTGALSVFSSEMPTEAAPPADGDRPMEWAPQEPAPKRRRTGLWVGLGLGALALAAGGASMVLIAPGTTIAGVAVGGMTPGMAAEAISGHLASARIELTGAGGGATVSGADLGASVDASALAEQAFADRPLWNVGAWMGEPVLVDVALDPDAADRALRAAVPDSYVDPVDATVAYDAAAKKYVMTADESGTGISVPDLEAAFTAATQEGDFDFTFPGDATEAVADITADEATAATEQLNGMLAEIGFYVGDERTVPVAPDVAAQWLTVTPVDGRLTVSADPAAIQTVVDTLPKLVDREVVNAANIVDSQGTVLREVTAGKEGRVLGDTSDTADDYATALESGDAAFQLPVTTTPFETTDLYRRIETDLGSQRVYLYENEKLVDSWAISSGLWETPTPTGRFKVFAHTAMQDMGCFEGAAYCTENVPWNTWFAPNIAFHGAYWHNNFGQRMSHGCVNLPPSLAKQIYDWAPVGLEVWVHS
ncbi:L,D-transpeptidase family protein [Microbacterium sp. NPDC058345]|uniref:L,D-transpeptidase family protein n=1 Tax=Microbacterium sp. NPDC058345 TaxID=3346455 RepID=UPI0036626B01